MLAIIALLSFTVLLCGQDVNVSGDWEMTSETPRGERTQTIHIEQEGEKLTVTMPGGFRGGQEGGEITAEGTIEGNKIEWSFTRDTPRGEFTVKYTGTVEGDTMTGVVEREQSGTSPWTAKRK